jgi:hypothetical protein
MGRFACVATAAVLTLALAACGDDDPTSSPGPNPSPSGSTSSTPTPSTSTTTPSADPTSSGPSGLPGGGTAEDPTVVEASTALLDWRPESGPVRADVVRSGDWSLTTTDASWSLDGPSGSSGSATSGSRVTDALLDQDWAVVVVQDKAEQRPQVAEVTDLRSGENFRIDGGSDVPTTTGGTWALGEGTLLHATVGPRRAYCLASVDLETRKSAVTWCAPPRHGFNGAHVTPGGTSLLTFDDSQPSCRTVAGLDDGALVPFEGVEDCKGWDALLTSGGAVWSVVPKQQQIENAHFYGREGDGYFDLGPGTAGSLVWCGGAAYFTRDPQREGDPATLMRWSTDEGLSVAYESPGGQAFLSEPRCGGDTITLTALAEAGDEQVSAPAA